MCQGLHWLLSRGAGSAAGSQGSLKPHLAASPLPTPGSPPSGERPGLCTKHTIHTVQLRQPLSLPSRTPEKQHLCSLSSHSCCVSPQPSCPTLQAPPCNHSITSKAQMTFKMMGFLWRFLCTKTQYDGEDENTALDPQLDPSISPCQPFSKVPHLPFLAH